MIKRLRIKFVAINMTIVTILLCAIFGLVFYFTSAGLERESLGMMQSIAANPFHLGLPAEVGEDVRLPFFTVQLTPYGGPAATGGGYYDLSDAAFLGDLIEAVRAETRPLGVIEAYNLRYLRAETPAGQCIVFADISSERATLGGLARTCALLGACSFFAFLGVSVLLSKWAVRPVERMWDEQRAFVAAASHELKTPLTVIMTNAELLQSGGADAEKRGAFVGGILTMSERMKQLIEQMLTLARADAQEPRRAAERVDLSAAAAQAALEFEAVFFERGLTLTARIEPGVTVTGCAAQLRQTAEILLDNAQKYAPRGAAAQIALERRGRARCVLSVANEGEEIPPEQAQNLFKRFYRADPARSGSGSFGLGLSIAETIVKRHRGRIWVESRGGVNRFCVELPCAPA